MYPTVAENPNPIEVDEEFRSARAPLPLEQLELYARELAAGHTTIGDGGPRRELLARVERNADQLEQIYRTLSDQGAPGEPETPSEEWLRDNHYVVRGQLQEIRRNLPRQYYEELPTLTSGKWRRYPRVYVFARDFVGHTAGRFDQESLRRFAEAYQDIAPLKIGELWAIPIMLRLALVENLCSLAVQTLKARQERSAARKFAAELVKLGKSKTVPQLQLAAKASATFVVEILHSLRDQSIGSTVAWRWLQTKLTARGQSPDEMLRVEHQREAIEQLSIANIINTMRMLSGLDWPSFVEGVSRVERILRRDPVAAYADMDRATRDRYRKSVEQIARRSRVGELDVAAKAVGLAESAVKERPDYERAHHVGYYLISRGRFEIEKRLGYSPTAAERIQRMAFRHPALGYLGSLAVIAAAFEASLLSYARNEGASWPMTLMVALLTIIPVSELAVSFLNTILTTIIPPRALPKLQLKEGIPKDLRTIVAVPTILSSEDRVRELVDALEVRALANHDDNLLFALLGDFSDAPAETMPTDEPILALAHQLVAALNLQHGVERFFLLTRHRQWNPSEGRWMGWERKRGKLDEFNRLLRGATDTSFVTHVGPPEALQGIRYVITLDSDTDLPLDTGRTLVGTLAHPLNRPRIDARTRRVTEGYGILQPRVAIGAVNASQTEFARVFSGHVGLDPYTTAVSDVYQDIFHEGSYVGKGIYDIDAFETALRDRVPDNALLSHDLFEGSYARVALCTDVELIDEFPDHYLSWEARLHRWVRGDWQLLPWLGRSVPTRRGGRQRNVLPAIARWKIFDNLRRSLLPPALIVLLLAGWLVLPGGAGLWSGVAFLVLFFPAYVQWGATFANRIRGVRLRDHIRAERDNLLSSLQQVLLTSAFLAHQSFVMLDAVGRTLVRLVSRRHLLEWVTAADAASRLEVDRFEKVAVKMWTAPAFAVLAGAAVMTVAPSRLLWCAPVLALWAVSPWLAYRSGVSVEDDTVTLDERETKTLRRTARVTWRFFEELVTERDNWLVPDNYQEGRPDPIAHRTSPTNIGLQLLSAVSAWDFGYISATDCLTRLERTLQSVQSLARYRGHLFNWYDTQSLLPLPPLYVSTVDSGNFLGYLLTLKVALSQMTGQHAAVDERFQRGFLDTLDLFEQEGAPAFTAEGRERFREFRSDVRRLRAAVEVPPASDGASDAWLQNISRALAALGARLHDIQDRTSSKPAALASAAWWLDALASMARDRRRESIEWQRSPDAVLSDIERRAAALTAQAEELIDGTELDFLFDRQRYLFAIGYNVTEGRRDNTFYDALASEARLASFVAIATRHVSQEHWFKLGRLMTGVGHRRALVSWSASMFEYLMPLLVMRSYPRTLLHETHEAVVDRQIEYARDMDVPWGISESAYNVQDLGHNYQYRAFGVPGLGLKRGLADDLVIAPYASILAASLRPREVAANLQRLAEEGALGSLGYYDAIDFTPDRLEPGQRRAVVKTFMAHHHGMSLLALNNCLNGQVMVSRFHSEPRVQAAELLLQERSPHLVPLEKPPDEHKVKEAPGRIARPLVRRYVTPHTITPRAHVLSNGSYSVMVTNAGSGYSRWRDIAITRWREDATVDGWGTFCYIRDLETREFWSAGFHPTRREAEPYEVTFAPDRAVLRRRDADIETVTEVTVSPEDDAEIRRVAVTNHSRAIRELELTSYAEVVLAPQGADVAHPAFSNLFIESQALRATDAIICSRRPRGHESRVYLGHVIAGRGRIGDPVEFETSRESFVGRGGTLESPKALSSAGALEGATGAVLDPIVSLRVRLTIPPGVTARVSFATVVAENEDGCKALVEKYHDPQVSARAFALASTHSEIELRHLGATREDEARYQRLAGRLTYGDTRLKSAEAIERNASAPPELWKFGISGDLPLVLVTVADAPEVSVAQELLRAQEYLRAKSFRFDLLVLNEIPTSYRQDVQDDLQRIAESGPSAGWIDRPGGIFLRRGDGISDADRTLLRAVARAIFEGSRGSLEVQLRRPLLPPLSPPPLAPQSSWPLAIRPRPPRTTRAGFASDGLSFFNGHGGFSNDGAEYQVRVAKDNRRPELSLLPPAPWSNVVANPGFGFVATESTLGCSWSVNSYHNRLTPWTNDPVMDPPGEVIYLRDEQTGEFWSTTPSPAGREIPFTTRFGQGYVSYEHEHTRLRINLRAFVPKADPVKLYRLSITNLSETPRRLSGTFYVDWCLADNRSRSSGHIVTELDPVSNALFARNAYRADFGQRVAFLDTSAADRTFTGDRSAFIGRNGSLGNPSALQFVHLAGRVGAGLDACGAVQTRFAIEPGQTVEIAFVLGEGRDRAQARELSAAYRQPGAVANAFESAIAFWDDGLQKVAIDTPDHALNVLMNRWLIYQTLSCRYYARSAFYQSGGAFGFRDQLQDVLALLHVDPSIARRHILKSASRQFVEGDVQHWWHEPGGEGVRTRIQDDRLWLVYAALVYARHTGDWAIFDEQAPYIEQRAPAAGEHSVYEKPIALAVTSSLYDHCVRAIARTLAVGPHGLPLIGTGDWNDGMDEVGAHGQGESVWLGWFLTKLLRDFADLAEKRSDREQAALHRAHAARLVEAVEQAWDGEWYRRAYFDDGTPLGSNTNSECSIDAIAQSWAVISGAGDAGRAIEAMRSVERHLIDREHQLILLLTPPFDRAQPNPGYIRGYVPGVRENGGQYTHAALWVILAHALLGNGTTAYELLRFINPIHRSLAVHDAERYRVEPFVVAADIYSASGHAGRGGWTWYTGAAGWMYRIVLEYMLGIRREAEWLTVDPCIPNEWRRFAVTLRLQNAEYRVEVENPNGTSRGVRELLLDGVRCADGRVRLEPDSGRHEIRVVLGTADPS